MSNFFSKVLSFFGKSYTAKLVRFQQDEIGTIGRLYIDGRFEMYIVEQPWNNNIPFKSCVPCGNYELKPFNSDRHGFTWQLENPNLGVYAQKSDIKLSTDRYACEFHVANWPKDVAGCLGPGMGYAKGSHMVASSGIAMKKLRQLFTKHKISKLEIIDGAS